MRPAALILPFLLLAGTAAAQEPAAKEPDPVLLQASRARDEGRYGDAEALLRKALEAPAPSPAAAADLARLLEETGRTSDAVAMARRAVEGAPADTGCLVLLGRLLESAGDLAGAEKTLRAAVAGSASSIEARVALGERLRDSGRRDEAMELFVAANQTWADRAVEESTDDLLALVRGRIAIFELDPEYRAELQPTMDLLREPLRKKAAAARVLQAEIYTRQSQTEKVPNVLNPVLERNPSDVEALVAFARAKEARFDSGEAMRFARRALAVNPVHPGAVEVLALLLHGDSDRKGASDLVRRSLAAHPADRALLALDAVPLLLDGRTAEYEAAVAKVLALDPRYGRAFLLAARILEDERRFAEAAALSRRAVKVDPLLAEAWFSLGRNLLNLGDEKEAKEALDRSEKVDPWHSTLRRNFRAVLDELDGYATGSTKHFTLRIHPAEDRILRGLYEEALEKSFEDLRGRYGFDPQTPVLVEVFRDAGDFSARSIGVPGVGYIGICFGRVVTLDSPGALPAGAFCWRSTQHHELAHVFHLQMTKGRVPRWLTEGLAVHEEAVAYPTWIRNMDRDLVSALANGEVKGLLKMNAAFRGPGIGWAYYQGGLMGDWLEREFGWPKVLEMLRLYGEGRDDAGVAREALGLTPEDFDASFLAYCRRMTAGWQVRPAWSDDRMKEFRKRSDANPKDVEAHLQYAEACLQRNNTIDAGSALARGKAAAAEDPFLEELQGLLLLRTMKTPDRGMEMLRGALARGRDHFDLRMALARDAEKKGRPEEALDHYRRAKVHFPRAVGPEDPRKEIARLLLGLGRPDEATRELEERVSLNETDLQGRLQLAGIREGRGDWKGAAEILQEAVDILPIPGPKPPRGVAPYPAAQVHARLGRALGSLDRAGDAADSFRRAAVVGRDFDPRAPDPEVAGWLLEEARAAQKAGRLVEAKGAAHEALRLDPSCSGAEELLRSLQR